jgi:hypothetical protein
MSRFHRRRMCLRRWLPPIVGQLAFGLLILPAPSARSLGAELLIHPATGFDMREFPATTLQIGGASLHIEFAGVEPDLPRACIVAEISQAAQAVATYYGRFPVSSARILVVVVTGEHGVLHGTTWGRKDGYPALTRLVVGQDTTPHELETNWVMTHELVHTALASLPDAQHWLEEGIATYVEPIARSQAGQLDEEKVWTDMLEGMQHGEPQEFDRGLDRTHTWGRTYWGGALFCLVADVEIRKQTNNRYGLQDALRAIAAAGGTIDKDWPLTKILIIGDKATGTVVLQDLYKKWSDTPVPIDLPHLWQMLGIHVENGRTVFDDAAPLSQIRFGITAPRQDKMKPDHDCL